MLLERIRDSFRRIQLIWADGGYAGKLIQWVSALRPGRPLKLEIVKRSDKVKGFYVLPRRWVVERTFGWLGRHRRLSKDSVLDRNKREHDTHCHDQTDGPPSRDRLTFLDTLLVSRQNDSNPELHQIF